MEDSYTLINLNKEPDEGLAKHGSSGLLEILLKRASRNKFIGWMRRHKDLMRAFRTDRYLSHGLVYALEAGQGDADEIIETFISIYPELKETIMQAAIQLEKRGEERGIQQGIQQEKLEIAKQMLRRGHSFGSVQELTGLSTEQLHSLQ